LQARKRCLRVDAFFSKPSIVSKEYFDSRYKERSRLAKQLKIKINGICFGSLGPF
jgi:hypothetical protein